MEPGADVEGAMKRLSLLGIVLCACSKTATEAPVDPPPPAENKPPEAPTAVEPPHPGCMLVLDLETNEQTELGDGNCDDTTNPASTFKVPHALFALQTAVVTGPDDTVKWDGSDQYFDVWEQDHTLRTAIYHSVVWYFQRTARAIGEEKMTELLRSIDYGNADPSSAIDRFWLGGGSLLVTGHDQLTFMRRLLRDDRSPTHGDGSRADGAPTRLAVRPNARRPLRPTGERRADLRRQDRHRHARRRQRHLAHRLRPLRRRRSRIRLREPGAIERRGLIQVPSGHAWARGSARARAARLLSAQVFTSRRRARARPGPSHVRATWGSRRAKVNAMPRARGRSVPSARAAARSSATGSRRRVSLTRTVLDRFESALMVSPLLLS